jgi:hypothetical protein
MAADVTVTVDQQTVYQTMDGFGDSHEAEAFRDFSKARSVSFTGVDNCLISDIPYAVMNMGVNLDWWERTKGFFNNIQGVPEYIGQHKNVKWSLFIGQTASWMTGDDVIESIGEMLVRIKRDQGYMVLYISYSGADPAWVKKAGSRFAALGLTTKIIVGEDRDAGSAASYIEPFLKDATIQQYLGPIGYRTGENPGATQLQSIGVLSQTYGKPAWNMESVLFLSYSPDSDPGGDYAMVSTWSYAWLIVDNFFKNLKYSHAAACLYRDWSHPLLQAWDCSAQKFPSYHVVHQFAATFPVGSQVVDATSSDNAIWSLAAKKNAYFGILLVNSTTGPKSVAITGIPNGAYQTALTDATNGMASQGGRTVTGGAITVTVPASSMLTISTNSATAAGMAQNHQAITSARGSIISADAGAIRVEISAAQHYTIAIVKPDGALAGTAQGFGPARAALNNANLPKGVYYVNARIGERTEVGIVSKTH